MQSTFNITITREMVDACLDHVGRDNKISAIKEVRTRYAVGLREAKELVESVIPTQHQYKQIIEITRYVYAYSDDEAWDNTPDEGIVISLRKT